MCYVPNRNVMSHLMHITESCHTSVWVMSKTSCHTCVWVMSKTSCHTWCISMSHVTQQISKWYTSMCHVTHEWIMSQKVFFNASCHAKVLHVNASCLTCEWVISCMNESRHRRCSFMSAVLNDFTQNQSCHTYGRVMSLVWMSHVINGVLFNVRGAEQYHTKVSFHTCEWVMSHIWMCHVTHMKE